MIENTNSRRYEKMTDDDDEIIVVPTNLTKEGILRLMTIFFSEFLLFCPRDKKSLYLGSFSRNDNNKKNMKRTKRRCKSRR